MGHRLGIIAGSGESPGFIYQRASELGYVCFVAGIRDEAEDSLSHSIESFQWFELNQILDIISYFKEKNIEKLVLAGKIDHRKIYSKQDFKNLMNGLGLAGNDRSPTTLINLAIDFLAKSGLEVLDPTEFFSPFLFSQGVLTSCQPTAEIQEDIRFGWEKVRTLADLDIGQTLVVKDKAVVAIEGMEGTDAVIKRGGQLAGPGTVVIKTARTSQDPRIDFPAVGLSTIKSLVAAQAAALCIEGKRVAFFQKEEAVSLADEGNIVIISSHRESDRDG